MTDEALITYFSNVADKVGTPILIYNIPQVTGVQMSMEAMAKLSEHENIVGIKDSSGNMTFMLELCQNLPDNFIILSGSANIFALTLAAGALGGILAISNVIPEPFVEIQKLFSAGKHNEAVTLQERLLKAVYAIQVKNGVPGVKAAMDLRGLYGGPPRRPLLPASKETVEEIDAILENLVDEKLIPAKKIS
jgi:4-hydroxy-2-oxoglutarate aldolase